MKKSWFVIQGALKCAVLAERALSGATAQDRGLLYLPYQSGAQRQAARSPPPAPPSSQHNHLDTQSTQSTSNMFHNRASATSHFNCFIYSHLFLSPGRPVYLHCGGRRSGVEPRGSSLVFSPDSSSCCPPLLLDTLIK